MNKAYLNPRLFKVVVTFPYEATSYAEPREHSHVVGGAVASRAWAEHIGSIAAGYDGHFTVYEYDCGDWIKAHSHAVHTAAMRGEYDDEIPL